MTHNIMLPSMSWCIFNYHCTSISASCH